MPARQLTAVPPDGVVRLLTIPEVVEILAVGRTYVYERIHDRSLPTVQLGTGKGSKRRVNPADLQAFIAARTTQPNPNR